MVSMKDIARACGVSVATVDHAFHNRLAVLSDNVQGAETLVRYACAKGHRKIAYLHGEKNAVTRNRLEGFRRACRQLGLEIPEAYVRESAFHNPDRCALDVRSVPAQMCWQKPCAGG